MIRTLAALVLASLLAAGDADPLAKALALADGDPFAFDAMEQALSAVPSDTRPVLIARLDASGRDDVNALLHRLIQDDDPGAAAVAIDGLARRWPTDMRDVEMVRMIIPRANAAGAAACRYAAAVRDDEALTALCDRVALRPNDEAAEQALRRLVRLPGGCGPEGWHEAVAVRQSGQQTALTNAERLMEGSASDAISAITLVAGMRPSPSRAARILLAAIEHPDRSVRATAQSILTTCDAPVAVAWRAQRTGTGGDPGSAGGGGGGPAPGVNPVEPAGRVGGSASPATGPMPAAAPVATGGPGLFFFLVLVVLVAGVLWLVLRRRGGQQTGD